MAGHAVEHDYHLIPPSPWPFLSGCAALVWGLGMVTFFTGLVQRTGENPMAEFFFARGLDTIQGREGSGGGWIILVLGCLFAAIVMFGWWRDVIREAEAGDHTPVVEIGLRYGMIMFIMQLLLSGTTVTWAHHALIHNDRKGAKWGLGLTVALGVFFTLLQVIEYLEAYAHRDAGAPWLSTDIYGSTFFLATGFHGLHVLIGTIFLAVCFGLVLKGKFRPEKHFGFEAAAWYWHFVDVVWLFGTLLMWFGSSCLPLSTSSLGSAFKLEPYGVVTD